ncbi:MAG: phosphate ABC transporter substrate-binding protein PstS [Nitriliruptorales bacterium]
MGCSLWRQLTFRRTSYCPLIWLPGVERMRLRHTPLFALLLLALLSTGCGGGTAGDPRPATKAGGGGGGLGARLVGAGATFPEPLYLDWIAQYKDVQPAVSINYQGIGSGGGIQQFVAQSVQFAGSDAYLTEGEIQAATEARGCPTVHVPTVFGAVAIPFNIPGIEKLTLDGPTLARIFLGEVTSLRDPAIVQLNPAAALPDQRITVVHRSDSSGTTSVFTTFLADVSPSWDQRVGKGKEVQWPVGIGGQGNDGVTAAVRQTPGAIGYVELSYVLENQLTAADMVNADGNAVTATLESTAAAADGITIPEDLRFDVLGVRGQGYPIVGATWILAHTCKYSENEGAALKDFLVWALQEGDATAQASHYAPIPDALQERALEKVNLINSQQ